MKNILQLLTKTLAILLLLVAGTVSANATNETYYSKVTATVAESGGGKVYVSEKPTETPSYNSSSSASASNNNSSHNFFLYTHADEGYILSHWLDKDNKKVTSGSITVKVESTKQNSPTQFSYTAVFKPSLLKISSNNLMLGDVAVTNGESFEIGDKVTLKATRLRTYPGDMGSVYSSGHKFEGWFDQYGNNVSDNETYTFKIEEPTELTARFSFTRNLNGPGFYRASWLNRGAPNTEYLTLVGNYTPFTSIPSKRTSVAKVLELHTDPTSPGCIVKVTGKFTDLGDNLAGEEIAMDALVLEAQGVSTADILSKFNLQLRQCHNFGYTKITATLGNNVGSLECDVHSGTNPTSIQITQNHPTYSITDVSSYFDFQPIDEEHVDQFYWGANADETMYYDGRYWCTMYAGFPFRVYDDIKVYYISSYETSDDATYAIMEEITDGCVPAATPVLLACPGMTAAENRMIPSMDEFPALETNLLRGEYQLNTKNDAVPKATFDGAKMRVLGVNDAGKIGFFKLAEGTELAANKAWLDVSSLAPAQQARIKIRHADSSGVENVAVDETAGSVKGIYDLHGRKVENMIPGQIYIIDGKKVLYRR